MCFYMKAYYDLSQLLNELVLVQIELCWGMGKELGVGLAKSWINILYCCFSFKSFLIISFSPHFSYYIDLLNEREEGTGVIVFSTGPTRGT